MTTTALRSMPVFGDEDDDAEDTPRTTFGLVARYRRGSTTTKRTYELTAFAEADTGSLLLMLGGDPNDSARQWRGMTAFMMRALVDDDGVSASARARLVSPDDLKAAKEEAEGEDKPSTEVATTGEAVSKDAAWRFVFDDGQLAQDDVYDSLADAEAHAADNPSSLRRFLNIIADPECTTPPEALNQIIEHIAGAAAGRPTGRSRGSSASPNRRTRRART